MKGFAWCEEGALRLALASAFFMASSSVVSASVSSPPEVVGEVSNAIGVGVVKGVGGQEQSLKRGTPIRAGDRIETASGGHVHIRFIDGGLVSVRPLSRLLVESYRGEGQWGPASIKFKLEEGVMRSATGQWGEAARDRFRLNTPLAAIGVKGTDFVVKADASATYASVVSGAIVMAPLEGQCAAALGPCAGERSVLLSADMQGKMLELLNQQQGLAIPRLVPAVDLQARYDSQTVAGDTRRGEKPGNLVDLADKISNNETRAVAVVEDSRGNSRGGRPMVWLHNAMGWNVPENTISQRFSEAAAEGRTAVTGNFFITLYRDESVQAGFLPVGTQANFSLTAGSATYIPHLATGQAPQTVQISNPTLSVDFAKSTFNTRMDLASPGLGRDSLNVSGGIDSRGLFVGKNGDQSVAGAFNTDGRQAGYAFDKTTAGGRVNGLTLWGR